jgi:hypothetical protein
MGYLGLDETPVKDDNLFQRLFWPSDNASDCDALGVQGFWICILVAALSAVVTSLQGHWILGLVTLAFFTLGGIGVREHSVAAAILVAVAYLLGLIGNLLVGLPPGVLSLIAALMLLTNIRATSIAHRWAQQGDPEIMPERRSETMVDRFVDQMPMRVWPPMKVSFFCIAGAYFVVLILGTVVLARSATRPQPPHPESFEITVPGEK